MKKKSIRKTGKTWYTKTQIMNMSVEKLAYGLQEGTITERNVRTAYTQLRKTAQKRLKTLSQRGAEFGKSHNEEFLSVRELGSNEALVKELHDVSRFLKQKNTTLTGLKKERSYIIEFYSKMGFEITNKNYPDFIRFMEWYRNSEYIKKFGSDQPQVADAFNMAKGATPEDWRAAMEEVISRNGKNTGSKTY